jgi:hypothetical protein
VFSRSFGSSRASRNAMDCLAVLSEYSGDALDDVRPRERGLVRHAGLNGRLAPRTNIMLTGINGECQVVRYTSMFVWQACLFWLTCSTLER